MEASVVGNWQPEGGARLARLSNDRCWVLYGTCKTKLGSNFCFSRITRVFAGRRRGRRNGVTDVKSILLRDDGVRERLCGDGHDRLGSHGRVRSTSEIVSQRCTLICRVLLSPPSQPPWFFPVSEHHQL